MSFEKFPLTPDIIKEALSHWQGELGDYADQLCSHYPLLVPGFHRLQLSEHVLLTLIFGDVNDMMRRLNARIDCWFLDGFKPSSNPEMWSEEVFSLMARLSKENASFATFTAAGFVKRGLEAAGFETHKVDGFGRKREMLAGRFIGQEKRS